MGLDTSHDCWHGAYSAFGLWRKTIAKAAGYAVWGVKTEYGFDATVMIDWGHITPANLMGEWNNTPSDPLIVLIAHSDCEGVIHPTQAILLADRLSDLLPLLPSGEVPGHIGDYKTKTQKFIDGLRLAVEKGEDVRFS